MVLKSVDILVNNAFPNWALQDSDVFDIVFLRNHIVAGMATAFAIWASCWGFSFPDEESFDSQDAELERRSKHQRYQLKGIAYLAFCTKVLTGLWWWAATDKLKGYTGILACTLSATVLV